MSLQTSVPRQDPSGRSASVVHVRRELTATVVLLVGFTAAVLLRVAVGGPMVARSEVAGLVFAAALVGLSAAGRTSVRPTSPANRRGTGVAAALGWGVLGAVVLCVPAVVAHLHGSAVLVPRALSDFPSWAAVVLLVAGAEELFLRGVLFRRLVGYGVVCAVVVPAIAFALLHLPLYGWGALPLDLAVGVWLGALRVAAGSWGAPAVAHVLADYAGWWLV